MSWFQYNWKAHREMCTIGASTWEGMSHSSCLHMSGSSGHINPFDLLPQELKVEWYQIITQPKARQLANQAKLGTTQCRQGGVCRLYNRAPAVFSDFCVKLPSINRISVVFMWVFKPGMYRPQGGMHLVS